MSSSRQCNYDQSSIIHAKIECEAGETTSSLKQRIQQAPNPLFTFLEDLPLGDLSVTLNVTFESSTFLGEAFLQLRNLILISLSNRNFQLQQYFCSILVPIHAMKPFMRSSQLLESQLDEIYSVHSCDQFLELLSFRSSRIAFLREAGWLCFKIAVFHVADMLFEIVLQACDLLGGGRELKSLAFWADTFFLLGFVLVPVIAVAPIVIVTGFFV